MVDELIAFLKARIDEDEAGVRALAEPHQWHTGPGDDPDWENESTVHMWPPEFHTPYEQDKHWRGLTTSGPALATYIARHDPARVLREVEAKRLLLDRYEELLVHARGRGLPVGDSEEYQDFVLPVLALPYASHPSYREEWRP